MPDPAGAIADMLSGEEARAEAAARRLPSFGSAALPLLMKLVESSDAESRWWATRALAGFADEASALALRARLEDSQPSVRQCAAVALRARPTPATWPALARALSDGDALVRRLAADALAVGGRGAIPYLREALNSGSRGARIEAARALAAVHHPEAISALYAALDDPSPLVQHWAEQGLDALGLGMVYFSPD